MAGWRDRKPENIGATFRPPGQNGQRILWLIVGLTLSVFVNIVFLLGLFGIQDISQEQSAEIQGLQQANQDRRDENKSLRQELSEARSEISVLQVMLQATRQRLEGNGQ